MQICVKKCFKICSSVIGEKFMSSWFNPEPPQFEIPRPNPETINLIPRMYTPLLQTLNENELKEVREAAQKAFDKQTSKKPDQ